MKLQNPCGGALHRRRGPVEETTVYEMFARLCGPIVARVSGAKTSWGLVLNYLNSYYSIRCNNGRVAYLTEKRHR